MSSPIENSNIQFTQIPILIQFKQQKKPLQAVQKLITNNNSNFLLFSITTFSAQFLQQKKWELLPGLPKIHNIRRK